MPSHHRGQKPRYLPPFSLKCCCISILSSKRCITICHYDRFPNVSCFPSTQTCYTQRLAHHTPCTRNTEIYHSLQHPHVPAARSSWFLLQNSESSPHVVVPRKWGLVCHLHAPYWRATFNTGPSTPNQSAEKITCLDAKYQAYCLLHKAQRNLYICIRQIQILNCWVKEGAGQKIAGRVIIEFSFLCFNKEFVTSAVIHTAQCWQSELECWPGPITG